MKYILKLLVDMIYLFPLKLSKFKKENPDEKVIAYGACKGVKLESEECVKRGIDWINARRGFFFFTDKKIVLGNWELALEDITRGEVLTYRSGMVLKVTMKDGQHYQFGLQYTKAILDQQVLKIDITHEKVKYGIFSVLLRVFIFVQLARLIILKIMES